MFIWGEKSTKCIWYKMHPRPWVWACGAIFVHAHHPCNRKKRHRSSDAVVVWALAMLRRRTTLIRSLLALAEPGYTPAVSASTDASPFGARSRHRQRHRDGGRGPHQERRLPRCLPQCHAPCSPSSASSIAAVQAEGTLHDGVHVGVLPWRTVWAGAEAHGWDASDN
jgi:hypothetical protein